MNSIEAIKNDLVAQAHLEDFALKIFNFADNEDRAGRANKYVYLSGYKLLIYLYIPDIAKR